MSRFTFFVSEAFRALRRQAAPSIAAIVTVGVTTLLVGVLIPVLRASESKNTEVREQIGLRVFLFADATKDDIKQVRGQIKGIDHVDGVDYISKQEAVQILKGRVEGDLKESLNELRGNPLPASFDVSLDDPDNLEAVQNDLQPAGPNGKPQPINPIIEEVNDARSETNQIREVTGDVQIYLVVIATLLLLASLLLIANTIRLSIYARRREVEVMRLVGATNWFIRWPFVVEGILVGLMGALIAIGVLWVGKVLVVDQLNSFALIDNFSTVSFAPLVLVLLGAAVVVSALGSGITLRRFLRI
ncbi:MAG: permease-like cell division protein FtsX [bacterium]